VLKKLKCGSLVELKLLNSGLYIANPVSNIKFNSKNNKVNFGQNIKQDTFQNNSVTRFFNETEIKKMISDNAELKKLLAQNKIPQNLNMAELKELQERHCKDTQEIALNIAKNLPQALKQQVNIKNLKDGAMLHDFGKVLIPPEILNKTSSLTPEEHKIMDLHTEIGYQLLKNSGVNDEILNLVKYHHNNIDEINGNKNFIPDINLQILNLADKYSALTEPRVYKDAFNPKKALTIIYSDVKQGKIHPFLFNALVKSIQNTNQLQNITKC